MTTQAEKDREAANTINLLRLNQFEQDLLHAVLAADAESLPVKVRACRAMFLQQARDTAHIRSK